MALTPQLTVVRNGRAVRLVAPEGTFSYYHPDHTFTGYGWDALSGSLLLVQRELHDVLILGLGGGTVARQCRALLPEARIFGIEADSSVIAIAQREFAVRQSGVIVVHSTGQAFLASTRRRYDAILDDMWPALAGEPKIVERDPGWAVRIRSKLKPAGVYAINLYARIEKPTEISRVDSILADFYDCSCEIRPRYGQTATLAVGEAHLRATEVRGRIRRLAPDLAEGFGKLSYSTLR